jgi:hypothetical protein
VPLAVKSFGIVLIDRPPESKSDSLERFLRGRESPPISRRLNRFQGQKNGPSVDLGFETHDRGFPAAPTVD